MIIDLLHNKIVKDTVTEGFLRSVSENLIPLLKEKHGESLFGIQMYEDYISDGFSLDGEWYYPMTLLTDSGAVTEWIKWRVDKSGFKDGIPYSYVGEGSIEFLLAGSVPPEFSARLAGRARFCESGLIELRVETTATDPTFLSGKYSQTFIDEMARQLTAAISSAMSVEGLADSSLSLALVFAPETYMEHTSESVTYRRLILADKSSAPRDLWIKWTRLGEGGALTVSDNVGGSDVCFELGEDVSQKIREKEYRFLLRAGKDKYHNAMGRKNITEWRELIKRAVRRGELMKIEKEIEISEQTEALSAQLAAVLGIEAPVRSEAETVEQAPETDEFALAMKLAREAVGVSDEETEQEEEETEEESDELEAFYGDDTSEEVGEGVIASDEEEAAELDEITRMAMEALRSAKPEPTEVSFDGDEPDEEEEYTDDAIVIVPEEPTAEEYEAEESDFEEFEDEEALEDAEDEEALRDVRALEPEEAADEEPEKEVYQTPAVSDSVRREELEDKIRAEVEAKIRLEYESRARIKAEEEAARLRREQEELRLELERLQSAAKRADEERERQEQARRAEEERLRTQIEQQIRAEAKERERLAEAARLAVEEQRRLEEERERVERMRIEEERRAEEERRRAEEARRIEAERLAEAERIRREAEERASAAAVPEAPAPTETQPEAPRAVKDTSYTYVSKLVRLRFRRSVDPNITARIHEIIKATIEYYGKEKVYLRIKATVPDTETVCLEFVEIPMEEMELLSNIIKVLGNSGLGIAKAIVE